MEQRISAATGRPFIARQRRAIGGGCINQAWRISGIDQEYFVKVNATSGLTMFEAEAAGLAELAASGAVRIPEPIGWGFAGLFAGYSPMPSLLHRDLWGGNAGCITNGELVIFDPAAYYGEADLAMTELFGGFPEGFYAAYRETWPLDAGYLQRRTLYNLYHILNHLNLFGGGYRLQAERMIQQLLAELK